MARGVQKSVRLKMKFSGCFASWPLFEDPGREEGLEVDVLRGRVTDRQSWYGVRVAGMPYLVDEAVRQSLEWQEGRSGEVTVA